MGTRRTIVHVLDACRAERAEQPIYRVDRGDRWETIRWREATERSTEAAAGLYRLGARRGDRIAILSETRAEWSLVDLAVLGLGCVVVGVYPTAAPDQMQYVLAHCGARILFVENEPLADKIRALTSELPELTTVVAFEPIRETKGEATDGPNAPGEPVTAGSASAEVYDESPSASSSGLPRWLSFEQLLALGRAELAEEPGLGERCLEEVRPEDAATIVYTSGTTGPPKGAVLTHANLFEIAELSGRALGLSSDDESVLFLPLAHSLLRVSAYAGLLAGTVGAFCPSPERLPSALQQIEPTTMVGVPRFFEKIHARVMAALGEQPRHRQRLFAAALRIGQARSHYLQRGERVPPHVAFAYRIFDRVVLRRVRARIFGPRLRWMVSGGAPMARELLDFFDAIGMRVLEGYGLTETSAPATLNVSHAYRLGSVGRPMQGVSVRIADDGEVLIKGPGVFREYYRDPEGTRAAFTEDGWFRSGDVGRLDEAGYLYITDRKKDLIITAGGKNVAPQNVENLLRSDVRISQVLVHGDRRKYLTALITLDPEATGAWLRARGLERTPGAPLPEQPAVRQMVRDLVEATNQALARYERIVDFRIVPQDFSIENGLLTPTLKLRRRDVERRYRALIDEMYPAD